VYDKVILPLIVMSMTKSDVIAMVGFSILIYVFILFYFWIQGAVLTLGVLWMLAVVVVFASFIGFLVFCGFSSKMRK
jgi:polyferredoxin